MNDDHSSFENLLLAEAEIHTWNENPA